jgi:hypothetical protein
MHGEDKIVHRLPVDKVFLNYSLKNLRGAGMVPGALRVYHGNGAGLADSQTVRFCSVNPATAHEIEFDKTIFEKFPCLEARFEGATFRLALIAAEKDVAACFIDTEGGGDLTERNRQFLFFDCRGRWRHCFASLNLI